MHRGYSGADPGHSNYVTLHIHHTPCSVCTPPVVLLALSCLPRYLSLQRVWGPAKQSVDRERGELEQYIIAELKSQGVTTEGVNISPWDWRCVCCNDVSDCCVAICIVCGDSLAMLCYIGTCLCGIAGSEVRYTRVNMDFLSSPRMHVLTAPPRLF
jgi:hypothetical protein